MESITFDDIINDKEYLFIPKEKPIQIKTDHHVSAESIFSNNDGYNKIKIKESKKTPWVKTDHSLKKDFDKDILEHNYYVKPDEINELQEIMKELDYISLEFFRCDNLRYVSQYSENMIFFPCSSLIQAP